MNNEITLAAGSIGMYPFFHVDSVFAFFRYPFTNSYIRSLQGHVKSSPILLSRPTIFAKHMCVLFYLFSLHNLGQNSESPFFTQY